MLMAVMIATSLVFAAEGLIRPGQPTEVFGMPVVAVAAEEPAWIALGGVGVIVLGVGFGVVAFTLYGAGVFFATGQLAGGLIAFGQLAVGLLFFAAQLGVGITGVGQLAVGGLVAGQVPVGFDGEAFLRRMDQDVARMLTLW